MISPGETVFGLESDVLWTIRIWAQLQAHLEACNLMCVKACHFQKGLTLWVSLSLAQIEPKPRPAEGFNVKVLTKFIL